MKPSRKRVSYSAAEVVCLYESMTIHEIARHLGVRWQRVRDMLRQQGITPRNRGQRPPKVDGLARIAALSMRQRALLRWLTASPENQAIAAKDSETLRLRGPESPEPRPRSIPVEAAVGLWIMRLVSAEMRNDGTRVFRRK